jgi:hypothetical protein
LPPLGLRPASRFDIREQRKAVRGFGAIDGRQRLAFLDLLPDVFHVDLIYSAVIECRDNAVDILIILKNPAKPQ